MNRIAHAMIDSQGNEIINCKRFSTMHTLIASWNIHSMQEGLPGMVLEGAPVAVTLGPGGVCIATKITIDSQGRPSVVQQVTGLFSRY